MTLSGVSANVLVELLSRNIVVLSRSFMSLVVRVSAAELEGAVKRIWAEGFVSRILWTKETIVLVLPVGTIVCERTSCQQSLVRSAHLCLEGLRSGREPSYDDH